MPRQTDNKLANRKHSKATYDKHDPHARNKDRRAGVPMSHQANSAATYGEDTGWSKRKVKERRSRNKVDHRHGQPSKSDRWA